MELLWGIKMAVSFTNTFMAKVETDILSQRVTKLLIWKRFIDDVFSLGAVDRNKITKFIEQASKHHPTIKFTAEISDTETTFLDTKVYKGENSKKEVVLDVHDTHFKPTETFQYTHYYSCCPQVSKRFFIKGEALRLLRTNSSKILSEEKVKNFKQHFQKGYPENWIQN